ncbi:MAG: hypothetical protein IJ880_07795 [Bacilli bacterium]|nr:hypothetical protein [Bacilli bacterium]
MVTLQNDLLEIYNNLVEFSKTTVLTDRPIPITVKYEKDGVGSPLLLEQKGISVRLRLPIYYCLVLDSIKKPTYLLPDDYNYLMNTLQSMIADDRILDEWTCLSPENYGFDIYAVDLREFSKGPDRIGSVRFVSGNSWLFRLFTKWKYKL